MDLGSRARENLIWIVVVAIVITSIIAGSVYTLFLSPSEDNNTPSNGTAPKLSGEIAIDGIGTYSYNPKDIVTIRPDIFKPGYFSIFDILVWLNNTSQINMDYYFNETVSSHLIRSIDGKTNFWYSAYYSGGWHERNVFRMDHYPVKDDTTIRLFQKDSQEINDIYSTWFEEIERKKNNDGKVIIPKVIISKYSEYLIFQDVNVTTHNLRSDMLQSGVITALDTLLSLEDQYDNFTVGLRWYESIGQAEIVKNYWVEQINSWHAEDRCGFVYEAGDEDFPFFSGNHIHIPSDICVINSPEYVEYFWLCI